MPTIQNSSRGHVVQIWGKAYIRGTDGVWRPLSVGEAVPQGTEILTEQNAIVMMTRGEVAVPRVAENPVERAIAAVENNEDPPAAGLQGGGSGDMQPGLRVDRIVELVTPASIGTRLDSVQVEFGRATQSDPGATALGAPRLIAASSSIAAVEAGSPVNLGLRAPTGAGTLTITVTALPTIGQVFTAAGTPVITGAVITADELAGLTYTPPADYMAGTPVGTFGYSVSNGIDSANGGTRIAVTPVNDAPLAIDASNSGGEDLLLDVSLRGTDIDGTVASVTVRALPANGTLLLRDTLAPVAVGAALTPAQAGSLVFRPNANWNGSTALTFTVTDNEGLASAPATVQLQITPVNDPPLAINDTSSTVAQAPVTVAVLGNDTDADNDPLTVTGASVAAALGNVVVNGDGTLTFIAAPGVTGPVVISYTISDPSGATSTATLTVNVAATPAVTVDAPALTNDRTPTLTGTSNLPPGSTVTLTVTDALGAVQTFTTTVRADGTYSVDVPALLAEGPYTAVANVTGPGGTSATANDNGVVDITPPFITVDAPALTNDTTPALTGTTDLPAGSTITLTVTGANGVSQLFSTTVQAGGVFSVDVPAALVSGPFSVSARGTDAAGNTATASDNGVVDNVPPVITVDAPALTNDTTPPLTGTTDLPVGATVTLTVTGANGAVQTFTTTVQAGGVFSVSVPAALVEGNFSVTASGTDAAGNTATASDNGVIDITPPTVTVDAPALTNDTKPPLTGTTNLPAGSTVSLTVTGANGASQTFTATVQAGGVFSVDVPAALVQGTFNVVATATDAAGNSASANDSGVIDTTPPIASLTIDPLTADNIVNAGEATGNITLTGTVGGDVRVGDTVTLNVNGVNYTGLVLAGNTFAISVPGSAVLADADRRIDGSVTTTDNAGNSATATAQRPYAVNSAPIAVNDTLSIGEDTPSAGGDVTPGTPAQDRDADGDTLTVIGVATGVQPSAAGNVNTPLAGTWGTLLLDGFGAYTYAPSAAAQALDSGQTVTDTFTYTISDGRGGSATATLTVSVVGANDPTTISGVFIGTVTEDAVATASGTLTNNDPDVGTRPFVVQTNSPGAYGRFSIDAAGDWTYTLTNAAANVQALAQGQSVSETFIVATDDGTTASITVTVNGTNDAPVVSSTSINAVEEGAAVGLGLAVPSDIDNGSVLTITVTGLPTIGQVQLANGTAVANGDVLSAAQLAGLRYLPPTEYDGVAPVGTFAYRVSDGIATVNGGTTITVSAVNDPPTAFNDARTTGENSTLSASVPAATDIDGTVSSYTLASNVGAGNGSLAFNADGSYVFNTGTAFDNLAAGQSRTVSFTYTATDNSGAASAPATVTITVTGANDAPTGADATYTIAEDGSRAFAGADFGFADIDAGDTLARVRIDSLPAAGALTLNGTPVTAGQLIDAAQLANLVFAPAANANGANYANFTFSVQDSGGLFDAAPNTITFNLTAVNDPPVAVVTPASGDEDTPISVSLTGTDIDGTIASVRVTALPGNGTLFLSDGITPVFANAALTPAQAASLIFVPAADFNGSVSVTFTVTDNSGATSAPAVTPITVAPVVDPTISIDDVSVDEAAGTITFTVTLDQPTTATVSVNYATANGTATSPADYAAGSGTLSFAPGVTTQTVTLNITDDAVFEGNETFNVLLSGAVNATIADGSGLGTITDNDTPTLTVSSPTVIEGGFAVFTVSLSNASTTAVTFNPTLASGTATVGTDTGTALQYFNGAAWVAVPVGGVTLAAGTTSVQVRVATTDDFAAEGNETFSLTATVTAGTTANASATGTATITDDSDATTLTLAATTSVAEGGVIVYTATLDHAAVTPLAVNLSTGQTINIAAGATSGSVSIAAPGDDPYIDAGTVSRSIASTTGGGFEALNVDTTAVTTTVTDTIDSTTVSITGDAVVAEGATAAYTVSLTSAAQTAVTVNLTYSGVAANGSDFTGVATVTIPAGASSASFNIATLQDVLAEGAESFTVTIGSAAGGNFENLVISGVNGAATTSITDDDTPALSVSSPTVGEGGFAVFTVSLSNPSTTAVTFNPTLASGSATVGTDTATALEYFNGTSWVAVPVGGVALAAGATSVQVRVATIDDFAAEGNEAFTLTATVTAGTTANASATGTATISDDSDATTVSLTASATVAEGGNITYTATLDHAAVTAMTVTLSNGATITVAAGATSGSTSVAAPGDDVYVDAGNVSATIASTSGGGLEAVTINPAAATTAITDTIDTTTATLTATPSVAEGGTITYTVSLTAPVTGSPVTVTLANGQTINIAVGASSGSVTSAVADNVYAGGGSVSNGIASASGGNFEQLTPNTAPVTTTVTDDGDVTTVSLSATASVVEGGNITYTATLTSAAQTPVNVTLANGATITIAAGATSGTVVVAAPGDDPYIDAAIVSTTIATATGGNFESLQIDPAAASTSVTDDVDPTTVSLSATASVAEGGSIVYTATLTNAAQTPVTVTLSTGESITIAAGATSGSVTIAAPGEDVYVDAGNVSRTITSAVGGNFESLTVNPAAATTTVTDTIDTTTVSITGDAAVAEGATASYTVSLTSAAQTAVTVNLSYSGTAADGVDFTGVATVTIAAGSSSANFNIATLQDTLGEGAENFTVTIGSAAGGNFENLAISSANGAATTSITDDDTPTIAVSSPTVVEGGFAVFTVSLSNASTTAVVFTPALTSGTATVGTDTATALEYFNGSAWVAVPIGGVSIAAGSTSVQVRVATTDDVAAEGNETFALTASVSSGNTANAGTTGTATISDDTDATTVTLTATPSVAEGGSITYTATLSNAAVSPMTVVLSSGATIGIAAGATSGSTSVAAPGDDVYIDAGSVSATIASTSGGSFEAVTINPAAATTSVTDTIDTTTATLTATPAVPEGGTITWTVSLGAPVTGSDVTVTLAGGQTITIPVGSSSGTATGTAPDNVYGGGGSVSNNIVSASGGNFEQLTPNTAPVTTTVTDDGDITTVSLAATPSVVEGGSITYTATLTYAAQTPVSVTLSNGAVITIAAGATTGTVSVAAPGDDPYLDASTVSATISTATGGNFESLQINPAAASTNVTDDMDPTTVSLSASASVAEGGSIVYTATLTNAAQTPVTVTLSTGESITIAAGATSGSVSIAAPTEDVYLDAGIVSRTIASASGGNFESLTVNPAAATTTVTDTIDATTVSITGDAAVAEGATAAYTISLMSPAQTAVTVTLAYSGTAANGTDFTGIATVSIPAGASSAALNIATLQDVLAEGAESFTVTIGSASGGNFESLVISGTNGSQTTQIIDDDTPTLSVSSPTVGEGGFAVFTVSLSNPSTTAVTFNPTLSSGTATVGTDTGTALQYFDGSAWVAVPVGGVTLAAGATSVQVRVATTDDFAAEGNETFALTATVTAGTTANASATGTATITDDVDATTVTLTATPSVAEGGNITYTATLDHAAVTPMTVTLSTGQTITVAAGATTGTVSIAAPGDDPYIDAGSVSRTIASTSGGSLEAVTINPAAATTAVTDTIDTTTATLTATPSVAEGGTITYTVSLTAPVTGSDVTVTLANGQTVTILVGSSSGSVTAVAPDNVYGGGASVSNNIVSASGGNYEQLTPNTAPVTTTVTDDGDVTTVSLSATASVVEGGNITYTATLTNAAQTVVSVTLSNGAVIPIAAGATTGTVSVAAPGDDPYIDASTVSATISTATGGNFESLQINPAAASTNVTDDVDPTSVSLSATASVAEGGSIVYTATLTDAAQTPVTVTLSTGETITIAAGATSGSVSIAAPSEDVYIDAGSVSRTIASASGGNFESLTVNPAAATTTVTDTIDATTVSITGDANVVEGATAAYTVSLTSPAQTAVTVNLTYSGTAADGADFTGVATVAIPAGSSSANFNIATLQDVLAEGSENFTVTIASASGSNFESLVVSGTNGAQTTQIIDDDTPTLSVSSPTVGEGGLAVFTVSLSNPSTTAVTFNPTLTSGTATVGTDTATSLEYFNGSSWVAVPVGGVTLAAGATSVQIRVATTDDFAAEGNETFNLTANVTAGTTANASATGTATITDDIDATTVTLTATPSVAEGGSIIYTATIDHAAVTPMTVTLSNGATIAIAAGATSGTATVLAPSEDPYLDAGSVSATISSTAGGGLEAVTINPAAATTTVTDTIDTTTLSIAGPASVTEGATGVFTVSLTSPAQTAVTVNLTYSGTAANGSDYTGVATVTIAAGASSATFNIATIDDNFDEVAAESFTVTVASASGGNFENLAVSGTNGSVTTAIIDNDAAPTIAVSSPTVAEAGGFAVFTVSLSNPSSTATTVSLALADGTATAADYGPALQVSTDGGTTWTAATSATFAAGATSVLVRTPVANDAINEIDETFTLSATRTAGTTSNASATGTATITDDDATPSVSIGNVSVNESAGTMTFTVALSAASGQNVSVNYGTSNGTATAGADYTAASGTLTFAAGVTSQTITVAIAEDTIFEGNETLNVTLSAPSNATIASGTGVGTIIDNDAAPTLAVSSPTVIESDGFAVFTLGLSNPSATATSFNLTLANGSATAADYGPALEVSTDGGATWTSATSATIAAGATSVLVRTPIANDALDENNETFTLTATTSAGTTSNANASGTATITDDDATPSLAISDVSVNESAGTMSFTVTLSAASGLPVSVGYATSNGSATAGADYTAASGTLNFAAGVVSQTVTVNIAEDAIFEGNETLNVTLSSPTNATIADNLGVGTIIDNDAAPTLAVSSQSIAEAGAFAVFTLTLSNPSSTATTVNLALANGSATGGGTDYGSATATNLQVSTDGGTTWTNATSATFAAGATSVLVRTPVVNDTLDEIDETFTLTATTATGTTSDASATGTTTIADDDATPSLAINDVTVNEAAGTMTFTVTLSAASGQAVSVNYATSNGTATAVADYTAGSGTLSFAPGVTSQTVTVTIAEDTIFEGNETLNVTLSAPTNATIADSLGVGTITDNDAAPTLTVSSPTVAEAGGFAVFTLGLSNPSSTTTTVNLALADLTATGGGTDYGSATATNLQVSTDGGTTWSNATSATFAAGATSVLVRTPIVNDALDEANETFSLTATTSAGTASNASASGTATITDDDATPSLSISGPVSINEAAGTVTYTVTLSAPSGQSVSVNYGTAAGTATAGSDYTTTNGTLTFAPGVTSQTFTVPILNDSTCEGSESFTINLSTPSNATIATGSVTSNILDDGTGTGGTDNDLPSFTVSSPTVVESGGFAQFTVALSNATVSATTFNLALANVTATGGGTDYGSATATNLQVSTDGGATWTNASAATIAAGSTSVLVRTPIANDTLDEIDETFTLTATRTAGTTSNALASGTATITDDDATPSLAISDVSVNESAGTMSFTVTLSAASGLPVSVGYATSNGSATAGADYTAGSGTLTFAPGVTSQTVTVTIAEDTIFEGNETLNVNLSAPVNATIADNLGVGTITDNDPAPTLAVSSPTIGEAGGFAQFTLSLSNPSATATTVSLALANVTATGGGTDYGSATATNLQVSTDGGTTWTNATSATFAAGATSLLVRTPVINDALDEADETFTLTATRTAGSTANASASGTATITDDDATPSLAINDVTVNESAGTMTFTVTLSAPSGQNVSVNYATSNGTATAGADYTAGSGTLSFAPGVTSQTVTVNIAEDTIFEGNETLNVTLSTPVNATIADNLGVGTITDNDAAPTLTVSSPTVGEASGFAVFTLGLSNPSSSATTVNLALANLTATGGGTDYGSATATNLQVSTDGGTTWTNATSATFAAGATSVLVRTPIVNDTLDEIDETFTLTATTSAGTTANAGATGTATITDDDATPSLAINDVTVNEAAGTMTFTVTLSAPSGQNVFVNYAASNGTATAGADYTAGSGTLSFAPGVTSQTVTVTIAEDTIFEGNETLNVTLSSPTNATIADNLGVGTITDNDAAPTLAVSSPTIGEAGGFAQFTLSLSNPSSTATTVNLALANLTANGGGTDYGSATATNLQVSTDGGTTWTNATSATFAAGATSLLVRTPIVNDALDEADETFTLTATTSAGTTSNASATGTATITDDDATPSLAINDVTVNEAAGTMTFTVTLSAASGQNVSVNYATSNGTATAGADYTAGSGTLSFAPGVVSQTVTVTIAEDTIFEGNETLNVTLSSPTNATIADNLGVGTITDNDLAPTLTVSSPTVAENGGFAVFTLGLSNPSATATSFSLALANGTAGAADYTTALQVSTDGGTTWASATTATIAAGATGVLVRTPVTDDAIDENDETFSLTATRTAGSTSNASASGTATITDNDATPSLSIGNVSVNENAGTMTFTVTLSAASGLPVSVGYATSNGTATAGSDYTAGSGTLNFAAGVTSQTITVAIADDAWDPLESTCRHASLSIL